MPETRTLTLLVCLLAAMLLMSIRPSTGMRVVALTILLAVAAVVGMGAGLKHMMGLVGGMN